MADIELVIKIPEEKYQWIKQYNGRTDYQITEMLYNRIRKGTPLPKGHGRLKDVSELIPDSDYDDGEYLAVSVSQIKSAPTIIEANEEGEVEK